MRTATVDLATFQNTSNWLHAQANQDLSTVPFTDIVITSGSANPTLTLASSTASVVEDDGSSITFTFTLDATATSDITVNFTVSGSAVFTTDYTQTGASSFTTTTGSVIIQDGTDSAVVTITPVTNNTVEPTKNIEIMIATGTGYDGGSPNSAEGSITNDDTSDSDPLVAMVGLAHDGIDGFSFVAAQDIPASTEVHFTDDEFDNTSLLFNSGEAVLKWTSPASTISKGEVIVITEEMSDVFTVTCSSGSGNTCGSISLISGNFAVGGFGDTFYAYEDSDDDPTNGVIEICAVLFTGIPGSPGVSGGTIPTSEDPSDIYLNAFIVDGFSSGLPDRTEYDASIRDVLVNMTNFVDIDNWEDTSSNDALSTTAFANLNILDSEDPTAVCQDLEVNLVSGTVTIAAADVDGGSTDNMGIASLSLDVDIFDCSNIGDNTVTLTVTDAAGNEAMCTTTITVVNTENTLFVDASRSDNSGDGLSFATAFRDLQFALDVACEGTEIRVAQGTYLPTESPDGVSVDTRDYAFSFK